MNVTVETAKKGIYLGQWCLTWGKFDLPRV